MVLCVGLLVSFSQMHEDNNKFCRFGHSWHIVTDIA